MITEREETTKANPSLQQHPTLRAALGLPRKLMTTALFAAAAAGLTVTGCRGADITGPSTENPPRASADLVGTSDGLISSEDDEGPLVPATHTRMTEEEAKNDPDRNNTVETTFPVTESVYNTCRGELVVLNGELRRRMRVDADPFTLQFKLREWKDTRGVAGSATATETYDHDGDPTTPMETRTVVVRYHNKEVLIDQFTAGPAAAPFRSEFISHMHLQREGRDQFHVKQVGDDLFVFVKQIMKIDVNGQVVVKHEFRAECQ